MTYADIADTFKQTYCPRQYFYTDPSFKDTEFFKRYCKLIPCRGDIACNRAACWDKLINHGPYVQNDFTNLPGEKLCPSDFFGRLAEYAHDCGAEPHKIFLQQKIELAGIPFLQKSCSGLQCRLKQDGHFETINNICWRHVLAELKAHQK